MSSLPTYVERLGHGEIAMMPPGVVDEATVVMFAVPVANQDRLQSYVDEVLTKEGGPSYHPLGSTLLFCFLSSPKLTSGAQQIGFVGDHEMAVWVPLVERIGSKLRFVVWMPYIWVDTDIAMVTGREIWGYPKALGQYDPPADKRAPHVLTTRIFETFSPETEGTDAELIRVEPAAGSSESTWDKLEDAVRSISEALDLKEARQEFSLGDDARLVVDFLEMAITGKVPIVNLKQFRDSVDGSKACYQAIIDSTIELTKFRGGGPMLGIHRVTIKDCASHRLVDDLGLPGLSFDARFAAWVTMDFLANPGPAVWTAG